jgi:hypothetical protein
MRVLVAMLEGGGVGDDVALDEAADSVDNLAIQYFIHHFNSSKAIRVFAIQLDLSEPGAISPMRKRLAPRMSME